MSIQCVAIHTTVICLRLNRHTTLHVRKKIAFVDSFNEGKLSYIIQLASKYTAEKDTLAKDVHGNVRTVSFKAWLNRNDTYKMVDTQYNYGYVTLLGVGTQIQDINAKYNRYSNTNYNNYVDEVFHAQLVKCLKLEEKYFAEHDEYTVLKKQFYQQQDKYHTTFGIPVEFCSDGGVYLNYDDNNGITQRRPITIEELKFLNAQYAKLDALVENITANMHITH